MTKSCRWFLLAGTLRSPEALFGDSTRLTPLKLKSNSTRYVGGSAETRQTIVPSASCTFWLKATPLIVRPLRFTFTRWFGSNTPEPPQDHLVAGLHREGDGASEPEPTI